MKQRIKKILSIVLILSLIWGIVGSIASVKSYAINADITLVLEEIPDGYTNTITGRISVNNNSSYRTFSMDSSTGWTKTFTIDGDYVQYNEYQFVLDSYENLEIIQGPTKSGNTTTVTFSCAHDYTWRNDSNNHWRECRICSVIDLANPQTPHTYGENGNCTVCDFEHPDDPQPQQPSQPEPEPEPEPEPVYVQPVAAQSQELSIQEDNAETDNEPKGRAYLQLLVLSSKLLSTPAMRSNYTGNISLDMGKWVSFEKDFYIMMDTIISYGGSVTINYIFNGRNISYTIPAHLPLKLTELCDNRGYLGFENLRGILIAKGYISPTQEDIAILYDSLNRGRLVTNTMAGADLSVLMSAPTNTYKANSKAAGAATSGATPASATGTEITAATISAMIENAMAANHDASALNIGDNPSISADMLTTLLAKNNLEKNCYFMKEGKIYVLFIPGLYTSEQYDALFKLLAQEPGGQADPVRIAQLFQQVGINSYINENSVIESATTGSQNKGAAITTAGAGYSNQAENTTPGTAAKGSTAATAAAPTSFVYASVDPASMGEADYTEKVVSLAASAPYGSTVKLNATDSVYLNELIVSALETRSDVSLAIDVTVNGVPYTLNISAGYLLRTLLDVDGKIDIQKLIANFATAI